MAATKISSLEQMTLDQYKDRQEALLKVCALSNEKSKVYKICYGEAKDCQQMIDYINSKYES